MNILHITDPAFADRHWQALYALLELLHERYDCRFARIGWEQTKERFLSLAQSDARFDRFVVFDGPAAIGWAEFLVFAAGTDNECASVRLEAADAVPPEDFERLIAAECLRQLETCRARSAHLMAETEHVSNIARRWFANELNQLTRFRLDRATAQVTRMQSWLTIIPQQNPELRCGSSHRYRTSISKPTPHHLSATSTTCRRSVNPLNHSTSPSTKPDATSSGGGRTKHTFTPMLFLIRTER